MYMCAYKRIYINTPHALSHMQTHTHTHNEKVWQYLTKRKVHEVEHLQIDHVGTFLTNSFCDNNLEQTM